MADIWEPKPTPTPWMETEQVPKKKHIGTTLVTILAGFGGIAVGFVIWLFHGILSFYSPYTNTMYLTLIGAINSVLGFLTIIVGIAIWNHKYELKNLGIITNAGMIVLSLFFFIGIMGLIMCICSFFVLLLFDPEKQADSLQRQP